MGLTGGGEWGGKGAERWREVMAERSCLLGQNTTSGKNDGGRECVTLTDPYNTNRSLHVFVSNRFVCESSVF